jgi:peptidoglycan/LPS O-acetylase OafA/YrhL
MTLLHADPQLYNLSYVAVSVLALLAPLGAGSLSWRFFEKPLIRRGHSYSYGDSTAESRPSGLVMNTALVER